jgi:Cytotoxic translational repressor of toxin-antitoxin stability system
VAYRIEFARKALREFQNLPAQVKKRLKPKIDALGQNPRPRGVKKIEGKENLYRIRVGDYRVIYEVLDKVLLVLVVKLGDRKDIYKYLGN